MFELVKYVDNMFKHFLVKYNALQSDFYLMKVSPERTPKECDGGMTNLFLRK